MKVPTSALAVSTTRVVTVDYGLTPKQLLDLLFATRKPINAHDFIIDTLPHKGSGVKTVEVKFFNPGHVLGYDVIGHEYDERRLIEDPYAQIKANIDDPGLADTHPNAIVWWHHGWRHLTISCDKRGRNVMAGAGDNGFYNEEWYFAGVNDPRRT